MQKFELTDDARNAAAKKIEATENSQKDEIIIPEPDENIAVSDRTAADFLPERLKAQILKISTVSKAGNDVLALAALSTLSGLAAGATVALSEKDSKAEPMIFYTAAFLHSGAGKSDAINRCKEYLAKWLEKEYKRENKQIKKQREMIEDEIKLLTKATSGKGKKDDETAGVNLEHLAGLKEQLRELKDAPDLFLSSATVEGLEASIENGSSLIFFLDEFGDLVKQSKKNEQKAAVLSHVKTIYDGYIETKRTRSGGRSDHIPIKGMGLYAASTIGNDMGLNPRDMMGLLSDGTLNRFLVALETDYKELPKILALSKDEALEMEIFGRCFHYYARNTRFNLTMTARKVYHDFIDEVNAKARGKSFDNDDTIGQTVRLPAMLLRIALFFHIANNCVLEFGEEVRRYVEDRNAAIVKEIEGEKVNIPNIAGYIDTSGINTSINDEDLRQAKEFLDFMERRHFSKMLTYAKAENGTKSKSDKYIEAIKEIVSAGKSPTLREIYRKTRDNSTAAKLVIDHLVGEKRLVLNDEIYSVL